MGLGRHDVMGQLLILYLWPESREKAGDEARLRNISTHASDPFPLGRPNLSNPPSSNLLPPARP